jgi:hypothetical protein
MSDFTTRLPTARDYFRSTSISPERDPTQPRFFMDPVQDEVATAREGRPIFRERELIQILQPGSPNQPTFEVTDEHRQRWPDQYAKFKQGLEQSAAGWPLEQWGVLSRAQVLEMKAIGLSTVEQLAGMSDVHLQQIRMGGRRLRDLAKAALDDAEATAMLSAATRENEQMRAEMAELRAALAQQSEMLNRVSAQLLAEKDKPHELATYVPGEHGLQPQQMAPHIAQSSLDNLPEPRRRGRPPKEAVNGS